MAGRIPAGCMSRSPSQDRYVYRQAQPRDAEAINTLLAGTPLGGRFSLSLERAPDPLAGDFGLSDNHLVVLGHDSASGRLSGMCERTVLPAFINGEPARLPYLGALRVNPAYRNRASVIRGGFEAVRRLGPKPGELPFALTSITEGNDRALRLLTGGVAGLPCYKPVGNYSTFIFRARRRRVNPPVRRATEADLPAIAAVLNRENAQFQFAPVWSVPRLAGLARHGLRPENFLITGEGARLTGCVAVWDQSARRQAVVRAYPNNLAVLRPFVNMVAPMTGLPRLPRIGMPLNQVALSHCAVAGGEPALFLALIDAALADAARHGFDSGYLGLASDNPLARHIKRSRRAIEYRTLLHTVHWPGDPEPKLDPARLAQPEAGVL